MSSFVEFSITDGTVVIDLLAASRGTKAGFGLQRYTPGRPQLKNGGVWQDSPLAVGRQLVFGIDSNTADALTLICGGPSQDFIIQAYEELDLLLRKAQAYWTTTWQQTPVYIRAWAKGELGRRYALIHYAKFDEYFDPYGQLFAGGGFGVATEEFVLGIERGLWLDLPPGESESVPITHDGNSASPIDESGDFDTNEGLVVGPIHNDGLTHVYQFTASGAVFSSNLLDGSPPYTLLGATQAVGNILYMGADQPFFSVKFELTVLGGFATIEWRRWSGASWDLITMQVPNFSFQTATPETLRFNTGTWAKTTINGHNKYWLRAAVTSVAVATSPVQGNRHLYAITETYVEIAESEIEGTQDALLRLSASSIGISIPQPVLVGLRSYDRGTEFQSRINVGTGNPSNITYDAGTASGVTEDTADGTAPGGASITATNTGGSGGETNLVIFHLEPPTVSSFFGRFRLFAHVNLSAAVLSTMRYRLSPSATYFGDSSGYVTGETKLLTGTASHILVDLGYITLPPADFLLYTDTFTGFDITIRAAVPSGETVKLYGIALMPSDEWTAEIDNEAPQSSETNTQVTVIDAISYPKYPKRAFIMQPDGDILSPVLAISNGVPILHASARQRLWFAVVGTGSTNRIVLSVRIAKAQRYISLRSNS